MRCQCVVFDAGCASSSAVIAGAAARQWLVSISPAVGLSVELHKLHASSNVQVAASTLLSCKRSLLDSCMYRCLLPLQLLWLIANAHVQLLMPAELQGSQQHSL